MAELQKAPIAVVVMHLLMAGAARSLDGTWSLLVENAGIASMHTQVTHFGTVVLLDRTNVGASQINLPGGRCRYNLQDQRLNPDCTAHSVEFTPSSKAIRPLFIETDTWCSSGQVTANGTLVQTGGDNEGIRNVRYFAPCPPGGTCDWVEATDRELQAGRWYSTNQLLEDGSQIVVGGRDVFTVEFMPPKPGQGQFELQLLRDTFMSGPDHNNYYPFVALLPDGNLWIFANTQSIIYNYKTNAVVKTLPDISDGPRNYPSGGSSVLLPLTHNNGFRDAQVLVCGGAQLGAFSNPSQQVGALQSCGRMTVTAPDPTWSMEQMPFRRCMGSMILLPNKQVLIINGAQNGSEGWGFASNPVYNPVLYRPESPKGFRFVTLAPSPIPRMYHSTANLLPDGRILVAGSNTHQYYTFTGEFPTELRLEAFSPSYLSSANRPYRPANLTFATAPNARVAHGTKFAVTFTISTFPRIVEVNIANAPFATHAYSQGQRLLGLETTLPTPLGNNLYRVTVTAPPTKMLAPSGYYMLFVVNGGIPSVASWIQIIS